MTAAFVEIFVPQNKEETVTVEPNSNFNPVFTADRNLSLSTLTTLRNKRKLAAVSRETPEGSRNSRSQNTLDPGLAQDYISQVSEEIERRVTKKRSKEIQSDRVSHIGCSVQTWRISSEATSSDLFRSRSGYI